MSHPEDFTTHPDYALPLAEKLPRFSMRPQKMEGVTHQQWLNGYLERRSAYIEDSIDRGANPTVNGFHNELVTSMPNVGPAYTTWLAKVSGAISRSAEPDVKRKASEGLSLTSPILLTEDGAARVIEVLRDANRKIPSVVEKKEERAISRAETVGRFILENRFKILDPSSGTVIDPRTLGEFEQEGLELS